MSLELLNSVISGGENFDDLFEKTWYSHLIKKRKPNTSAFKFIIAQSGIEAAEALFIDDAMINVEGAIKAGLQALHLSPGKAILDLGL